LFKQQTFGHFLGYINWPRKLFCVSNCYTGLIAFFYFILFYFYEWFNSCQHIIFIHDRHICYFWFKTCIPNISNIVCVRSTICDIITKTKYYFRYLLKPHGAHREIYKTTRGIYWKKKIVVLNFKAFFEKKNKKKNRGGSATPIWLGGGSATPVRPGGGQSAGLGLAKQLPWPKGVVRPPPRAKT
jgi:hypothetical protein